MGPTDASALHDTIPTRATGAVVTKLSPGSPTTIPTTPGSAGVSARRSSPGWRESLTRTSPASTVPVTGIGAIVAGNAGRLVARSGAGGASGAREDAVEAVPGAAATDPALDGASRETGGRECCPTSSLAASVVRS